MRFPWDDDGYQGGAFLVQFCDPAEETWWSETAKANRACINQLVRLIERFADVGKLCNKRQMRYEGDGIYAIKARCGLRAYGFYPGDRHRFLICLFKLKKDDKMSQRDRDKILRVKEGY